MKLIFIILAIPLSLPAADRFQSLLSKYCVECHGGRKTKGDVNLKDYSGPQHIYKNFQLWEGVVQQLEAGDMPPEDEKQMATADKAFFLGTLKAVFDKARTVDLGDPGPAPLRRLTRSEYNNSIRDTFGMDLNLGKDFPSEGGGGEGFDNNAEVLTFSPIMFEKYVAEAEKLSHHLNFNYSSGFHISKETVSLRNNPQKILHLQRLEDEFKAQILPPNFQVEVYLIRYMLACRDLILAKKVDDQAIKNYAQKKKLNNVLIKNLLQYLEDKKSKNEIEKRYLKNWYALKKDSAKKEIDKATKEFLAGYKKSRAINDRPPKNEPIEPYRKLYKTVKQAMRISDQEVTEALSGKAKETLLNIRTERRLYQYPIERDKLLHKNFAKLPPAKRKLADAQPLKYLSKKGRDSYKWLTAQMNKTHLEKQALLKKHITVLLRKAWRKNPSSAEVAKMMDLFNKIRIVKEDQFAARTVLIRTFCSPKFIFRTEKQIKQPKAYKISDRELAVRLSYLLWSSQPDTELMTLADSDKLSIKTTLDKQVDRMLKDPKARSLADDFAAQWLKFRDVLTSAEVDVEKFPQFNNKLAQDMYEECASTFLHTVQNDISLLSLVDSNYVFVNDNLAKIYGLKNIKGGHFRKVNLTNRDRGGLVTSPAVMLMTSYPLRTSPVLRGNYLISSLLGTPTPPPPPDVGELPEDDKVDDGLTVKQRLQKHRQNPQCAGCHNRLDPLGFPLEVFDSIGRQRKTLAGKPIDATGELKDGRKINGPLGLKKYLLEKEELFLENMTSKLLGYALGRSLEVYDKFIIAKAVRECKESNYKFSSLVKTIVNSKTFQYRRGGQ